MTKFEQLREEVSNRTRTEKEYWDYLQGAAETFRHGFFQYLGLESNSIHNGNGHQTAIVRLGRVQNGNFEACAPWDYEKDGKVLSFILFLTLPGKESMEAELTFWTKISLSKPFIDVDAITISTKEMHESVLCKAEQGRLNMDPFYDELFLEIVQKINIESL